MFPYVGSLLTLGIFAVFIPDIQAIFLASTAAAIKFIWDNKNKFVAITNRVYRIMIFSNLPVDNSGQAYFGLSVVNNASTVTPAANKKLIKNSH